MPTDTPTPDSADAIAPSLAAARPLPARPAKRRESLSDWMHVAGGVCVAGALYPVVVGLIALAVNVVVLLVELLQGRSGTHALAYVAAAIPQAIIFAVVGAIFGMFWTAIVALPTTALFSLFARTMQLRAGFTWLGAILGGLIGLLANLPVLFFAMTPSPPSDFVWTILLLVATGPALATVLGQAGGAWGAWYGDVVLGRARADVLAEAGGWHTPAGTMPHAAHQEASAEPLFQFRLRQLLWLTVWAAVFMAAVTATGMPLLLLAVFGVWLVYQAATLYFGAKLVRLLTRRRATRRTRRTRVAPIAAKK